MSETPGAGIRLQIISNDGSTIEEHVEREGVSGAPHVEVLVKIVSTGGSNVRGDGLEVAVDLGVRDGEGRVTNYSFVSNNGSA